MNLLRDVDLLDLVTAKNPVIEGIIAPENGDWYAAGSPIQPASVDLHIGRIYVPEAAVRESGSSMNPKEDDHVLKVGGTAIVETREHLRIPNHLAAFGFPPTDISANGILMTNPGHIDPGYTGTLTFTVINMGRSEFSLVCGRPIATLLFVRLSGNAHRGYASPHPPVANARVIASRLEKLGRDFLQIEARARKIAKKSLVKVAWTVGVSTTLILAIAAVAGTVISSINSTQKQSLDSDFSSFKKDVERDSKGLETRESTFKKDVERDIKDFESKTTASVDGLKSQLGAVQALQKIDSIEQRLKAIEDGAKAANVQQGAAPPKAPKP